MQIMKSLTRGCCAAITAAAVFLYVSGVQANETGWQRYEVKDKYGNRRITMEFHPKVGDAIKLICVDAGNALSINAVLHAPNRKVGELVRVQIILDRTPFQFDTTETGNWRKDYLMTFVTLHAKGEKFWPTLIAANKLVMGIPGNNYLDIDLPKSKQELANFYGECLYLQSQFGKKSNNAAPVTSQTQQGSVTQQPEQQPAQRQAIEEQPLQTPVARQPVQQQRAQQQIQQPAQQQRPVQQAINPQQQPSVQQPAQQQILQQPVQQPQAPPSQPAPAQQPISPSTPAPSDGPVTFSNKVAYACTNGAQFAVRYESGENFDRAVLVMVGISEIPLTSVTAASGAKYFANGIEWHTKGPDGILTQNGQELVCEEQ